MYDGLLLDHDGVLVTLGDHTALHDAAHDALQDVGISDPAPDAVDTLSIAVSADELEAVSERYDVDAERLWRARDDRVEEALRAETTSGRKAPYDDVDVLADLAVPTGIVSNNQTRIVEFVLDYYYVADYFDTVHARAPERVSLTRKKPHPTYLVEAMDDLDIENPLYVGDSDSDVKAGQRAGLDVAYIRRAHNTDTSLDHDPTYDVEGLDKVIEILQRERQRVD